MNQMTLGLWITAIVGGLGVIAFFKKLKRTPEEQVEKRRWLIIGAIAGMLGVLSVLMMLVRLSQHWSPFPH